MHGNGQIENRDASSVPVKPTYVPLPVTQSMPPHIDPHFYRQAHLGLVYDVPKQGELKEFLNTLKTVPSSSTAFPIREVESFLLAAEQQNRVTTQNQLGVLRPQIAEHFSSASHLWKKGMGAKGEVDDFLSSLADVSMRHALNFEATQFKNAHVAPFFLERLKQMCTSGFPFPSSRLEEATEIIEKTRISIAPERMEPGDLGRFSPYSYSLFLVSFNGDESFTNPLEFRDLMHEMVHSLTGQTISVDPQKPNNPYDAGRMGVANAYSDNSPKTPRANVEKSLYEAFVEYSTRWLISDQRPDFSTMNLKTFFKGPEDIPAHTYDEDAMVFGEALGNLSLKSLGEAAFEDFRSVDTAGVRRPARNVFLNEVQTEVMGGLHGLIALRQSFDDVASTFFEVTTQEDLMADNPESVEPSMQSDLDKLLIEQDKVLATYTKEYQTRCSDWVDLQSTLSKSGQPFHIKQGHTKYACVEPGLEPERSPVNDSRRPNSPSNNSLEAFRQGIAAGRAIHPPRSEPQSIEPI